MKVVINNKHGGFGLSRQAIRRLAELQGRPCYIFELGLGGDCPYRLIEDSEQAFVWQAFDIPNPNEVLAKAQGWHEMSADQKSEHNGLYSKHKIDDFDDNRSHPLLIQVVEELGAAANGEHASLKIVEVPDDVEWEIEEYDGWEHVAEKHQTWG